MNIIIVVFGIIGFKFLGIRDYPAIDPPNVNVRTSYAGANADIIETQVTEPLENLSTVLQAFAILLHQAVAERAASMWNLN